MSRTSSVPGARLKDYDPTPRDPGTPTPATALLPLIVLPVLGEDVAVDDVGASHGSDIIFLFTGGFPLALPMRRWNLQRSSSRASGPP